MFGRKLHPTAKCQAVGMYKQVGGQRIMKCIIKINKQFVSFVIMLIY